MALMKTGLVLLLLGLIMLPIVVAQATWISGYVKDAEGKPIAGAIVRGKGVFETSTVTDVNGYYRLGVSAGEWAVTVSYDTFEQATTVTLVDGEHKVVDFTIGTYATVHATTTAESTFTGYTTYYPGTTLTGTVATAPSFDYWWIVVIGVVAILGIILALATRKGIRPSPKAKPELPRKEAIPTELPTDEKERRVTCSACGYINPPYAVNYCVSCGARLK